MDNLGRSGAYCVDEVFTGFGVGSAASSGGLGGAGLAGTGPGGRVRCLRSALGWAYAERILDRHPLDGMRGPPQPGARLHASVETVRAILTRAGDDAVAARAVADAHPTAWRRTKTGRIPRLTLGVSTADLWRDLVGAWRERACAGPGERGVSARDRRPGFGPWLFSPHPEHATRLLTD